MSSLPVAQRKQALIDRASLARMHLRRDVRALQARISAPTELAVLFPRVLRGLIVARVAIGVFRYFSARVRKRTDGVRAAPHHRPSTGELQ